jgi:hypothetical protein
MTQVCNMVRRPFIDLTHGLQFLFTMEELRLIVEHLASMNMILKNFQLGPFLKGVVLSFRRDLLFLLCTRLARTVVHLVPFCRPT